MRLSGATVEEAASVAVLCFFGVAGAIPGVAPNQAAEMTGSAPSGLMVAVGLGSQLLVDLTITWLVLRFLPKLWSLGWMMQWAAALAVFAILSAGWSQDPVLSARRSVPFALAAVFGLYLASRFPLERQLSMLQTTFFLLAMATVVTAVCFPRIGLDASTGHGGNWQGVFTQKNACGRAMVFASAVVLARGGLTFGRLPLLACFGGVLVMSGSRGAWGIEALVFAALALIFFVGRMERPLRGWLAAGAAAFGLAAFALVKALFPLLAELAGRDATLTGRTAIWAQVWLSILKRPWLGYGFSAFWRGTKGASFDVVVALKFVLFHAHNGFLEIWLELGLAGLLLFTLSYARGCYKLWPVIRAGQVSSAAWPACVLLLIAAYDFDENTLLSFNGLFWVLYVQALVQIEILARRRARTLVPQHREASRALSRPLAPTGAAWL